MRLRLHRSTPRSRPSSTCRVSRRDHFECSGNSLPFQAIKNSTPSDSALTKSRIITSAESALAKNKDFKPPAINTCKKILRGHPPKTSRGLKLRNIQNSETDIVRCASKGQVFGEPAAFLRRHSCDAC